MKEKLNHVPRLLSYLNLPVDALDSSEFIEVYDQQANAFNTISEYLRSKGLDDEAVEDCMEKVSMYGVASFDYISLLFSINMSGGLKRYRLYKSLDDGTFKGSTLDFIQAL